MVAFYADLDAMGALSEQLKSVHRMLSSVESNVGSYDGRLGDGGLEGELASFISGWHDGRAKICDGVAGLSSRVDCAVEAYSRTEAHISHAVEASEAPKK
jgi:hypothetical protein